MGVIKQDMKYLRRYPDLGSAPLSVDDCVSPEYFELERQRVFKRSWLCIGRVEQAAQPGDYFVQDIEVLRTSILVVRGKDNKLRAFHNFCTHRLNKIMKPGAGQCKALVCQFHGWTFDYEGRLLHVDNEELFPAFEKEARSLHAIHLDTWEGFVFINVAEEPSDTLQEWLGPLYDEFGGYFDHFALSGQLSVSMNCNWKLSVDSQTEAYHAPSLHRRTLKDAFAGPKNPNCLLNRVELYERHKAMSVYSNPEYKPTPAEWVAGSSGSVALYPATSQLLDTLPSIVNPERNPDWAFDIVFVFPNLLLGPASGSCLVQWFWPTAVGKTRMEVRNYTYTPRTIGDLISQEYMNVHLRDVIREDFSTLEGTQEGMDSGVQSSILLCDEEVTLRHTHRVVEEMIKIL